VKNERRTRGSAFASPVRFLGLLCLAAAVVATPLSAEAARWTCNAVGTDQRNVAHHFMESGSTRDQAKSKAMNECRTQGRSQGVSSCEIKNCHQD
jgi:hypothetical protein